jgi:hypothetical protein
MADGKMILIILILGLLVAAYFIPKQTTDSVKWAGDGIKSIVGNVLNFNKCPETKDIVCGSNGVTYMNYCYAVKAKVNYTQGDCNAQ